MWRSPNGKIRNIVGGTVFENPLYVQMFQGLFLIGSEPICIGRHAFGDQYKATDAVIEGKGKLKMTFEPENGEKISWDVYEYKSGGVALSMYNTDEPIICFKRSALTKH